MHLYRIKIRPKPKPRPGEIVVDRDRLGGNDESPKDTIVSSIRKDATQENIGPFRREFGDSHRRRSLFNDLFDDVDERFAGLGQTIDEKFTGADRLDQMSVT